MGAENQTGRGCKQIVGSTVDSRHVACPTAKPIGVAEISYGAIDVVFCAVGGDVLQNAPIAIGIAVESGRAIKRLAGFIEVIPSILINGDEYHAVGEIVCPGVADLDIYVASIGAI